MKKVLLPFLFTLLASSFASAQQGRSPGGTIAITDEMVEASVKFDQKRFNLTPEQVIQDKKVQLDYQAKSNAIAQNPPTSMDGLKAAVLKARLEFAQAYKSFLTPEQYKHYLETYNKMHPNAQLH